MRNEATPDGGYLLPASSVNEPSEEVPYTRYEYLNWTRWWDRRYPPTRS